MSEIDKMQRYIERTNMKETTDGPYQLNVPEAFELARQVFKRADCILDVISLAFDYGKAKGYRLAKAEARLARKEA